MSLMESLGRQLVRKPVAWTVVLVALTLSAAGAVYASRVDQDDDLLAFLPKDNREVATFDEINERFGGLDVALVGMPIDNPFDGAFLERLQAVTRELDALSDVDHALSLTSVEDFRPDPAGGIRTDYLVAKIPESDAEEAALRALVMSRDHVVGNLISADARAVTIYCFATHGADTRAFAGRVREVVDRGFPDRVKYWGGAPFISTYIYDLTQKDMDRLIPWAVGVIVLIIVLSFRDVLGAGLALLSTGMGIAISRGLMGIMGIKANIVLSSMPVILFAVGSAYGIHIMVRYYGNVRDRDRKQALVDTMTEMGPTVLAAGLTTVAGLLSFVTMDIAPMRSFGLFTAIGILATLILALTFIPAVIRLLGLRGRRQPDGPLSRLLVRIVRYAHGRRKGFAIALLVLGAAAAITAGRVEARMENAAFFSPDSPPDRAERFLREHFGDSTFIQIEVQGDMTDPQVLREVQRTADELGVLPHVSSVNHIGKVLALANESMTDERRLPTTTEQVQSLYRVLQGKSAVRQLGTDDHQHAMLLVKIDTDRYEDVEALLSTVEAWIAEHAIRTYRVVHLDGTGEPAGRAWREQVVAARLRAHLHDAGVRLTPKQQSDMAEVVRGLDATADAASVEARLTDYLHSDESILEDKHEPIVEPLARALAGLGPTPTDEERLRAIAGALERDEEDPLVEDLDLFLATVEEEAWRQLRAAAQAKQLVERLHLTLPADAAGERARRGIAHALLDRAHPEALVSAEEGPTGGTIGIRVSGQPVLYRALSKSVTANQFKSLAFALALVLLIMCALFRSISSGLLAALPTVLTLLVVYGIMGLAGVHLDIGTSMLASIIIGAGVDYAVHLLAAWRCQPGEPLALAAERSARRAGPAIWTNALMVAAGFFVLTLGEARPLQNVGGLTSTAMITAALATFIALPVLARRRSYYRAAEPGPTTTETAPGRVKAAST